MYRKSQQIVILGRCRVDTSVDCELELGKIINKVHDYDCIPDIKIKEQIKGHLILQIILPSAWCSLFTLA